MSNIHCFMTTFWRQNEVAKLNILTKYWRYLSVNKSSTFDVNMWSKKGLKRKLFLTWKRSPVLASKWRPCIWTPWPNIDVIFPWISRQLLTSIYGQKRGLNVNFFWREKGVNSWRLFDVGIWRQFHVKCLTSFWRQELTLLSRQKKFTFYTLFWPFIDVKNWRLIDHCVPTGTVVVVYLW